MAGISLKNIFKIYPGDVTAVHDFNLEIDDKEFIILVGPSGCGKSTTLRMIAGLEEISKGELFIGDRHVNDVAPKDRNIAMVFQNYALYPHMSVYKNMAFGLQLSKVPKDIIKQKVEEAAKILDIEHLLDRKPKQLSGGQRQRVALGRAMVRNPAVFLLDEPLSNLDAKLRTSMRSEISKLHKKLGTTFIYVTHDQTEAMTMGDRIVVMKDGFIQQVDTPQNLYDCPCNLFVAGFIGAPQMNFIDAVVEKTATGFAARFGEAQLPIFPDRASKDKVAGYAGKEIVIGIRPEDLHIEPVFMELDTVGVLNVKVELTELMGSEIYLFGLYQDNSLISRIPARFNPKSAETVKLALDCTKLHLFDKESGSVIK
jgi:multiple sugar transport system ATP-binding protein